MEGAPGMPIGAVPAGESETAASARICASFERELQELTFNSKPIITSLTIIAGSASKHNLAATIARIVENRVHSAPPDQKLPTMYLMDSILKNIGGPYREAFARIAARLFTVAWAATDGHVHASLTRLLGTWRAAAVFDERTLEDVEVRARYLGAGMAPAPQPPSSRDRRQPPPPPPQQQQLPPPPPQGYAYAYQQQPPPMQPVYYQYPPSGMYQQAPDQGFAPQPMGQMAPMMDPQTTAMWGRAPPPPPPPAPQPVVVPPVAAVPAPVSQQPVTVAPVVNLMMPAAAPVLSAEDQARLMEAVRQFSRASPALPEAPAPQQQTQQQQQIPPQPPTPRGSSSGMPDTVRKLYAGVQCATCGKRFATREEQIAHASASHKTAGRAASAQAAAAKRSRAWYQKVSDWVVSANSDSVVDMQEALREADRLKQPSTPSSPTQASSVRADDSRALCAVCGERFEHYLDKDDEWMFRDAVESNGAYVHTKCLGVPRSGSSVDATADNTDIRTP